MAIKQLTVFVENKHGTLVTVTDILSKHNINLRALSIAETEELGILRLIVNDEISAEKVLEENGYLIKTVDVAGVKISDKPGKLTEALNAAWHAASEDMAKAAQAAGPQGGAQAGPNPGAGAQGGNKDGEVTDVDFEEVK